MTHTTIMGKMEVITEQAKRLADMIAEPASKEWFEKYGTPKFSPFKNEEVTNVKDEKEHNV